MKKIHITAPAKINLCLEVIKKYENGFHEIRSVMLKSQHIFDHIDVVFENEHDDIIISCDYEGVPTDEANICHKIATKYFEKIGKRVGLNITIVKSIPPLTGIGGGSSDGASVLLAIDEYFGFQLNENEMVAIAAEVGRDIPFFLQDAFAAKVGGAGEKVESIMNFPHVPILIVCPGGEIATPWAYGQLDEKLWFMNDEKRENMTENLAKIHTLDDMVPYIYNDFAFVAEEKYPVIKEIQLAMRSFGARAVSISGKGPTVFGIYDNVDTVQKAQKIMQKKYPDMFISRY
ncbi:MAG: 4-(cytidine 5'-diphospho)-2-C-methyl-D-erythritol kinase [Candidatus Moraniibacteriota bacterium]|nr:MAG: 4-(cytidine 5'-diphospho)-2-C-methyl-D-erythritol kinase [Candidatus Moranbacteria bacterium]